MWLYASVQKTGFSSAILFLSPIHLETLVDYYKREGSGGLRPPSFSLLQRAGGPLGPANNDILLLILFKLTLLLPITCIYVVNYIPPQPKTT